MRGGARRLRLVLSIGCAKGRHDLCAGTAGPDPDGRCRCRCHRDAPPLAAMAPRAPARG